MGRLLLTVIGGSAAIAATLSVVMVVSFRTGFRPVLDAVRRMNRRVLNPKQLRTAGQPDAYASLVHHVGRTSGTGYETPVVAVPTDTGVVVALPYGATADWVRNVVAAGGATVDHDGATLELTAPRVVGRDEADHLFPPKERRGHHLYGVDTFLMLDRADAVAPAASGDRPG